MTNKEWLDYLAHNAPDELAAWFDAEHVETEERALDGDTEPQNADSREQLEAEIESYSAFGIMDTITLDMVIGWLDRQAAITEREYRKPNWSYCETCEALEKLTAERDEWKSRWEIGKAQFDAILAERELYREALSQLLDTVTDGMGKVSAILDNYDEGMA